MPNHKRKPDARLNVPTLKRSNVPPPPPPSTAVPSSSMGIEQQAVIARARRIATCEREVWEALAPILERHRCRLGTVQEIVDGRGGAVRIVVFAKD